MTTGVVTPHCWISQFQVRQFTVGSDLNESEGGCSGGHSGIYSWHSMLLWCGNPWKSS
ncbi:hypothetical protein SLEP1_g25175 [Rubroshorea leprosula]|uniref:Uncharacterized protein n=1 Tax=Rubroshorea leprosula TaxID=152421 RepID=A0AAV5JVF1_9ROSI|nr:hypothetical protein SLEP1_g25175 [Rubroshorea leprosula]